MVMQQRERTDALPKIHFGKAEIPEYLFLETHMHTYIQLYIHTYIHMDQYNKCSICSLSLVMLRPMYACMCVCPGESGPRVKPLWTASQLVMAPLRLSVVVHRLCSSVHVRVCMYHVHACMYVCVCDRPCAITKYQSSKGRCTNFLKIHLPEHTHTVTVCMYTFVIHVHM